MLISDKEKLAQIKEDLDLNQTTLTENCSNWTRHVK